MKQILQSPRSGDLIIADVPPPARLPGFILVRTAASLVSAGTERSMVQFAGKSLAAKAFARPDLVQKVVEKARRDGVVTAFEAVQGRLDQPMLLGYSASGVVLEGEGDLVPGTRVACAGAGFANHAEIICVPRRLCVRLPDEIGFIEGAFATVGAIALHGFRLAEPQLGERVAVIGLGLLGQLAVQFAKAAGCTVIGVEPNPARADLARSLGASVVVSPDEAEVMAREWSSGVGVDAVLITADSSENGPVELAGQIARDRATVVAIGVVGMHIPRRTYFEKELRLVVSRSTGPGRYDPDYEEIGRDYPIGHVRWTEERNLMAFLDLAAAGSVKIAPLVTHTVDIAEGRRAYDIITGKTGESSLGVVLVYPQSTGDVSTVVATAAPRTQTAPAARIGMLGAGSFGQGVLLPALARTGASLVGIASRAGVSAQHCASRFGFAYCTTDSARIIQDPQIDGIVIATRHNLHARQVLDCRASGKHVFVEKPLCLTLDELATIADAYGSLDAPILMVGYNRRFAPLAKLMWDVFCDVSEPLSIVYRINAGFIPADHWVHDPVVGGGRVVGEVCHFVDFVSWLQRAPVDRVYASALPDRGRYSGDNVSATLSFANGGVATILYTAAGDSRLGKERVEVHGGGRSAVLTDFHVLETFHRGRRRVTRLRLRHDKGHRAECDAFIKAVINGEASPIALPQMLATSRATLLIAESARQRQAIDMDFQF